MKILAVTSGKGGVGKTTLSLNIARQLSLRGIRTLLLDFDIHNKGGTGLFLDRIDDDTSSLVQLMAGTEKWTVADAEAAARTVKPVRIDEKGDLLFVPATGPKEMVDWGRLHAANEHLVRYLRTLVQRFAEAAGAEAVIIDCYGGIDSLTVAAAGVADDTIIVNEPDIITFSGTLMLYRYLGETYAEAERRPNVHFVINRITTRHSYKFLNAEYEQHLSRLARGEAILAYVPYDKLVMETFGDYPFITELLPKGLLTRKIRLLIATLWPGEPFAGICGLGRRARARLHRRTCENPYADPERILRATVNWPIALSLPVAVLSILGSGVFASIDYNLLRMSWYFSTFVLGLILLILLVFEPLQMTRMFLRAANFGRRRRRLVLCRNPVVCFLHSLLDTAQSIVPLMLGLLFLFVASVGIDGAGWVPTGFKDVRIWRGELSGLSSDGDYGGVMMRSGASLSAPAGLQATNFDGAELAFVDFQRADMTEASLKDAELYNAILDGAVLVQADLSGANLSRARLREADLSGAVLHRVHLGEADLTGAVVRDVDFTGARLEGTILANAVLDGAVFTGATLVKTDLRGADLRNADLTGVVDFSGCSVFGATLGGNRTVSTEFLGYAQGSGAELDEEQLRLVLGDTPAATDTAPEQFSLRDIRDQELNWRRDQAEKSYFAAGPTEDEGRVAALYLVEYAILADDSDMARFWLREIDGTELERRDGINGLFLWFTLVTDLVSREDDTESRRAWEDWRDDPGGELPDWDWDFWDEMLPVERYDKKQLLLITELRDQLKEYRRPAAPRYLQMAE